MFNAQPPAHPTSIPSINCSDGVSRGLGCSPQRVPCEVPRHTCTQQGATHDAIHNASRTKAVSRKSPLYSLTSNGEATTPALGHRIIGRVNSVRSLTLVPTNMSLLVGRRSAHLPIPPEMEQSVRVYRPFGRTSLTHTHTDCKPIASRSSTHTQSRFLFNIKFLPLAAAVHASFAHSFFYTHHWLRLSPIPPPRPPPPL